MVSPCNVAGQTCLATRGRVPPVTSTETCTPTTVLTVPVQLRGGGESEHHAFLFCFMDWLFPLKKLKWEH